tara:strand:- start:1085 stop:5047 length:3963 start_codon:yes stop_codon:yes gene_type:complete
VADQAPAFSQPPINVNWGDNIGVMDRQKGPLLGLNGGRQAFAKAFGDESVYNQLITMGTGNTTSQRIDKALIYHREDADEGPDDYNFALDPLAISQPEHDWKFYADARTTQERDIIYNVLKDIEMKRFEVFQGQDASVLFGTLSGAILNPGAIAAMRVQSLRKLQKVAAISVAEEGVMQAARHNRSSEESGLAIGGNVAFGALFLGVHKSIQAITGAAQTRAAMNYMGDIEELKGWVKADEDFVEKAAAAKGPWEKARDATKKQKVNDLQPNLNAAKEAEYAARRKFEDAKNAGGQDLTPHIKELMDAKAAVKAVETDIDSIFSKPANDIIDDEVPFTEGPIGDVERRTNPVRLTPEDDLNDFDAAKNLDNDQTLSSTGGQWSPKMGPDKSIGEKLQPAWGMEKWKDNPVKRVLMGSSNLARLVTVHLVEHPFFQMKNLGGDKSFIGVSRVIASEWVGQRLVPSIKKTEDFYIDYRRGFGGEQKTLTRQKIADTFKGTGNAMGVDDFLEAVGQAKRRLKDPDVNSQYPKQVIEAAKMWDDLIYKPLGEATKKHRMFSIRERRQLTILRNKMTQLERESIGDAAGSAEAMQKVQKQIGELETNIKQLDELDIRNDFLNRLYNNHYIGSDAGRKHWYQVLGKHGYSAKEAEAARQGILGQVPYPDLAKDPVGMARSLKERTLADIPDTALEPFLENNIIALGRYYTNRMGTDVEMMKKFGSVDLEPQMRQVGLEYDNLIQKASSKDEAKKLIKERKDTLEDLTVLRDRVRGTYGYVDNPDSWDSRTIRVAKMWNATSMLTGALAAIPDIGMLALEAGINNGFKASFEALFKNTDMIKLAYQEANLAGEALDMTLSMRAALFADLGESIGARSPWEKAMGQGTQAFFNINLMNQWTTGMKSMASLMIGTRLIDDSIKSSRHLRNSGSAKILWKDEIQSRDGQFISASYTRKTNTVNLNKEQMEATYKSRAWELPQANGIRPLPSGTINSLEDWKRFLTEHELAHADHMAKKGSKGKMDETRIAYENRINTLALRRMSIKGKVEKFNRLKLLNVGIDDDMAARIAGEAENFGYFGEHSRIGRTHLWEDQEAANVYRAALGKDISRVIVTPGPGDLPNTVGGGIQNLLPDGVRKSIRNSVDNIQDPKVKEAVEKVGAVFLSPEMSRLIFQFKSFAISAQHRVLTPGLQQMHKNTLQGALALVAMGAVVDSIKRKQRNAPEASFGQRLSSAIAISSVAGYFPDAFRLMETGMQAASNPTNFIKTVGGPIVPQITNMADVLYDYSFGEINKTTNKHLINAFPLSNTSHLKWIADYSKGAVNAATGVE